jgi:hypothetical protein
MQEIMDDAEAETNSLVENYKNPVEPVDLLQQIDEDLLNNATQIIEEHKEIDAPLPDGKPNDEPENENKNEPENENKNDPEDEANVNAELRAALANTNSKSLKNKGRIKSRNNKSLGKSNTRKMIKHKTKTYRRLLEKLVDLQAQIKNAIEEEENNLKLLDQD